MLTGEIVHLILCTVVSSSCPYLQAEVSSVAYSLFTDIDAELTVNFTCRTLHLFGEFSIIAFISDQLVGRKEAEHIARALHKDISATSATHHCAKQHLEYHSAANMVDLETNSLYDLDFLASFLCNLTSSLSGPSSFLKLIFLVL